MSVLAPRVYAEHFAVGNYACQLASFAFGCCQVGSGCFGFGARIVGVEFTRNCNAFFGPGCCTYAFAFGCFGCARLCGAALGSRPLFCCGCHVNECVDGEYFPSACRLFFCVVVVHKKKSGSQYTCTNEQAGVGCCAVFRCSSA